MCVCEYVLESEVRAYVCTFADTFTSVCVCEYACILMLIVSPPLGKGWCVCSKIIPLPQKGLATPLSAVQAIMQVAESSPLPNKSSWGSDAAATHTYTRVRIRTHTHTYQHARPPWTLLGGAQELQLFLKVEGDLETNAAWAALRPIPPAGIVDGTAKLSKQLLGWERSVVDPVQVRVSVGASAGGARASAGAGTSAGENRCSFTVAEGEGADACSLESVVSPAGCIHLLLRALT